MYYKLPEKTIVSYANGNIPLPRGSKLVLTVDRRLIVTYLEDQEIVISNPIIGSIAYGVMNDIDNFVSAIYK